MLRGVVKSVLSGDTLVIMGLDSSRGPPPEKQVTLAYLSAPRLGNRTTADAPFAWASREWLRGQLIGKEVSFSVDYANQAARQFGTVLADQGRNIGLAVVQAGWARVQPPKPADGGAPPASSALEALLAAEAAAKEAGLGMWSMEEGAAARNTRVVDYAPDVPALLQRLQGERLTAVVEHVNSASSFRLLLLPDFQSVPLLLSGVVTPSVRRNAQTGAEEPQPFAREAKYFAESRVLHRTVRAVLEGVDKSGALVGTIMHISAEINLGAELLRAGLGRIADWSVQLSSEPALLRQAEAGAKGARLNLWRGYTPPAAREGMGEYQARVVEVLGADVLLVVPVGAADGDERRLCLSGVKAPRAGNERRGDAGEPWAYEAKEWTRRAAVGKKVRVVPEFTRKLEAREATTGTDGGGPVAARPEVERTYAAVFVGEKNLAAGLIGAGLAHVNTNARGEEITAHIDALHDAERAAKEKKLGAHSGKAPTGLPWGPSQDLTLPANKARAQAFLPALQRDTRVRATVLHVVHGARFKCLVPREGCVIGFALAGVRCPATARRDQPGSVAEPFADEAFALSRGALLQRDIEIEVESLDKNGVFLGTAHMPEGKGSLSIALLEAGLASRIPPAADRSRHAIALEAAEKRARDARLKVWEGWAEQVAAEPEEEIELPTRADGSAPDASAVRALLGRLPEADLSGTEVSDGVTFYAQPCGTSDAAVREAKRFEGVLANAGAISAASFAPKVGAACAARFGADGRYYRAKVVALLPHGEVQVFFVDFGNAQACKLAECRPLDPAISLTATPPLALCCKLAYLVAPPVDDEYGRECALALSETVLGRAVRARVERRQGGEMAVTLLTAAPEGSGGSGSASGAPSDGEGAAAGTNGFSAAVAGTLNAELVAMGLARVERRPEVRNAATGAVLDGLRALQEDAKKNRLGIWRHGDIEEDDCKEFGYTPRTESAWSKKK
ncbi:hypothetical protein KFE25_000386 [Diacronema lutheri]|uniref:Uncharacterized protein n=1 Tax=Diacronema lutheri TaxID=2081491 RepID=A0A8J5XSG2_DIALT|nr:hypothetical protein KFE25_000386 [Diacronema lutheri]